MHPLALGERKSPTNQPSQSLTQRIVETLHVARLTLALPTRFVLAGREHHEVRLPEVRVATLAAVGIRNAPPKPKASRNRSLANSVPNNLPSTPTDSKPEPDVIALVTNERPHLV